MIRHPTFKSVHTYRVERIDTFLQSTYGKTRSCHAILTDMLNVFLRNLSRDDVLVISVTTQFTRIVIITISYCVAIILFVHNYQTSHEAHNKMDIALFIQKHL